ncbi:MAG: N-acetylmuramoyl-L-alanine amidase [bacterium]|jgi:N-acetylmuramoyl-L-alanine amidase
MIFISAGHNNRGLRIDPGAIGNGFKEADLTVEIRDLVIAELKRLKIPYISDKDDERLGTYLERIKTGNGSVVLEFHFDASTNSSATGTTALIEAEADRLDRAFAKELSDATANILGIRNRGVKTEAESHRGRLALMREEGIICLLEVCFISNSQDVALYKANKEKLAMQIAQILIKYEKMI